MLAAAGVLAAGTWLVAAILLLVHIIGLVSLVPLLRVLASAALLWGILIGAGTAAGTLSLLWVLCVRHFELLLLVAALHLVRVRNAGLHWDASFWRQGCLFWGFKRISWDFNK
jgi:hypothetical protein